MATLSDLDSGDDVVAEGESREVNEATVAEKTEKAKRQRHPLRCSVCLDDFKDPKLLSCCHTFCKGCLERILEKSKEKKKLTCPQCRVEHEIPVKTHKRNLRKVHRILMVYAMFYPDIGYAQGMNDILARFLVVTDSEVDSYFMFTNYMEGKKADFLEDSMMKKVESRRKQLLSEAGSKCIGDLKKVWVQKEQVETTITALKSTLSFAERALQCSSDIELLSLSSQALSRLRELSKAKWDPSSIYEIEGMGLKFVQGNHTAYLQGIGKLEEIPPVPNDILVQNFPVTIPLGKKITFQVVGRFQKSKKCIPTPCPLKPENLHITIQYGGQSKKQMTLQASANDYGTCTVPFTPICGGLHRLSVSLSATGSPRKHYEFKTNVFGMPSKGARVCMGPDWVYDKMDLGTVGDPTDCQDYPGYSISVTWDEDEKVYLHRWGDNMCYEVQLANTIITDMTYTLCYNMFLRYM